MRLIHTDTLTDCQKEAVRALADACRKAEPITLSAPTEDGLDYYLVYEDGDEDSALLAVSFLFFVPQDEEEPSSVYTCEYSAFVHPKHRRKGYFTAMLNAALETADAFEQAQDCSVDFCFLTDEKSPDASAVRKAIGAEYWYSEYKMERALRDGDREYIPAVQIRAADADTGQTAAAPLSGLFTASLNGEIIGTCALLPVTGGTYLYAFQIRDSYRSEGHGKDFLRGMLALIAETAGCAPEHTVSVQVSGLNYIARNLYKKTGFRETEALSYYIY